MTSIVFYVKLLFLSLSLFYLANYGLKGFSIVFITQILIMIEDGGRTTFFPMFILVISLILMKYKLTVPKKIYNKMALNLFFIFLLLTISVLFSRALIMTNVDNIYIAMLSSLFIEGVMGSYPSLQTLDAIVNHGYNSYTYGLSYILDPFLWIYPSATIRDEYAIFEQFKSNIEPILSEKFAPMGGFYFISEANAMFPVLGPILITSVFAFVNIVIERKKRRNKELYFVYFSTVGLLFTKAIFGNIIKLFIVSLLCYYFINFIINKKGSL
jgi:hypothetical protein